MMMEKTSTSTRRISITNDLDIVVARLQVREVARNMGFGTIDQARISLAASELARVLTQSDSDGDSEIIVSGVNTDGHLGIQVVSVRRRNAEEIPFDEGGVNTEEMSKAMALVDEGFVDSENGQNTRVTLMKWLP